MRSVIRTGVTSLVVALVVLLGAAPANAVQAPPAPVDPFPDIVSQLQKSMGYSSGGVGGSPAIRWGKTKAAAIKRAEATAAAAAKAAAGIGSTPAQAAAAEAAKTALEAVRTRVPITAPAALPKLSPVAAGGPAGLALSGWFVIGGTGAAVSFVGEVVGADLDHAMCGADQWVQTGYGILTMGMGPGCVSRLVGPNDDVQAGYALNYGGFVRSYTGVGNFNGNPRYYCYSGSGNLVPTGLSFQVRTPAGSWATTSGGGMVGAPRTNWAGCGTSPRWALDHSSLTGIPDRPADPGAFRLIQTTGGAVVATAAPVTGDPMRDSVCTLTWKDGTTTTGHVGQYRESEGFPIGAVDAACTSAFVSKPGAGPDLLPSEVKIGSTNTENGAQTEIAKQAVPDFAPSEKTGLTPGDNTGLRLLKVVAGVTQSCMTWEADCASWWPKTSQGTQPAADTGTYRCEHGGREIALAECGVYRNTFDTKTNTPTITDPATGEQVQWSNTPGTGNSTSPGGAGDVAPGQACMNSWGAAPNPLEWVFHPVKCAFVWALVPNQSAVSGAVASLGAAAGDVAAVDPLLTLLDDLPNSSGCAGIPFDLVFFGTEFHGRILDACEGETRAVATVVNGLLALVIITGGVLAIVRYAAAVFGFVGPGGSMEQTRLQTERIVARSGKGGD